MPSRSPLFIHESFLPVIRLVMFLCYNGCVMNDLGGGDNHERARVRPR